MLLTERTFDLTNNTFMGLYIILVLVNDNNSGAKHIFISPSLGFKTV